MCTFLKKIKEFYFDEYNFINKNINIVSLGCNCLPRTVLTRQMIKPRKKDGELSCPFDLVSHPINCVTSCLENGFDKYCDDIFFVPYKKNFLDFRGKGLWQKNDGTKFFHDKDCKVNDREKLVNRIQNRIKNFYSILEDEKPILFVQNVIGDNDLKNLYSVLEKLRNGKKFVLVALDLQNSITEDIPNVKICKVPYPTSKYEKKWNAKANYNSFAGKEFEFKIRDYILDVIKNEF